MIRSIWLNSITICLLSSSCFQAGTQQLGSTRAVRKAAKTTLVESVTTQNGGVAATISAASTSNQVMKATNGTAIAGSQVLFPPGSLALDTNISIEESAPIASSSLTSELGLQTGLTQTGTPVAVVSSVAADAKVPFSLSIPLPVQTGLRFTDPWANLVVVYRVTIAAENNKVVTGVIPRSEIVINEGVAEISALHFGSFQAAVTNVFVANKIQVESNAKILTKAETAALPSIAVHSRSPFTVKAGDTVEINGLNFRSSMIVAVNGQKVSGVKVLSDSKASFVLPANTPFGLNLLNIEQDSVSQSVSLAYLGAKSDFPLVMKSEAEICEGEKFYDGSGVLRTGTRVCSTVTPNCAADGEVDCLATAAYPAMQVAGANVKIVSGFSVGGVAGTALATAAPCTADGGTNCLATTNFPAVNRSNLTTNVNKIATALTIAGVSGTLSNCSADAETNCITVTNFPAVNRSILLSAASLMSTGITLAGVTGAMNNCSINGSGCYLPPYATSSQPLKAINYDNINSNIIRSGHSIAGINGSLAVPDPWDVRYGRATGGNTGKLKVDCKNLGSTSGFNIGFPYLSSASAATDILTSVGHGLVNGDTVRVSGTTDLDISVTYYVINAATNSFQLSTTNGGVAVTINTDSVVSVAKTNTGIPSIFATGDDAYGFSGVSSAFTSANSCFGVEASPGDENVWKDVTSSPCTTTGLECRFKDKITVLEWSKMQPPSSWMLAMSKCENLTYDGYSDWRLPTQKELLSAYSHGIGSAASINWVTSSQLTAPLWSSTNSVSTTLEAFAISLHKGESTRHSKSAMLDYLCVRGGI